MNSNGNTCFRNKDACIMKGVVYMLNLDYVHSNKFGIYIES